MTATDRNRWSDADGWEPETVPELVMVPATPPPAASAQPATPGQALRWAAGTGDHYIDPAELRRLADELDAAPAVYRLPPEPPETVTELWSSHGAHWQRHATSRGHWVAPNGDTMSWLSLLAAAEWLSTAPPAGTEATDG